MEDYKKKYEEALERMKSWARGEHPECFTEARKTAEFIFPELAESEDERIRNEIIKFLELPHPQFVGKRHQENWIAWLEKQGEQNLLARQYLVSKGYPVNTGGDIVPNSVENQ